MFGIDGISIVSASGAINKKRLGKLTPPQDSNFKSDISSLVEFVNPKKLRRIAKLNQSAILAALLAKEDTDIDLDMERMGLLLWSVDGPIQTTINFLDQIIEEDDVSASPTLFSNSVHNSLAAHISIELGIKGPNMTIAGEGNIINNVIPAVEALFSNEIDNLILIYCEEINILEEENKQKGEGIVTFILSKNKGQYGFFDYHDIPEDKFNPLWGEIKNSRLFEYALEKLKG